MGSHLWEPGENGHGRCTTKVVEYVWSRVREGSLRIGDRLPSERAVAERLHVSRSSIRAGIAHLTAIGVVNIRPGQGVFISDSPAAFPLPGVDLLCGSTAEDLAEARLFVESAIVRVAEVRASEYDCAALAEELAEMYASVDDPADFHAHDVRFHRAMARACGNPILAAMAETLLARTKGDARIAGLGAGELKG
ncbi:MAG TPA: FCD domain-containing protein, partial [Acidobacteriaceae bacterium]|nr:FCD domain-containing protein [Acidobacteriaceae bacterium]